MNSLAVVLPLAAANSDLFGWVKSTIGTLYGGIFGVSTVALGLVLLICLLWRLFSSNPKTVELCNTWMKRAALSWIAIQIMGLLISYAQNSIVKNGTYKYNPAMISISMHV